MQKEDKKQDKKESPKKPNFVCPNCGSTSSLSNNNSIGCSYCFFSFPEYFQP